MVSIQFSLVYNYVYLSHIQVLTTSSRFVSEYFALTTRTILVNTSTDQRSALAHPGKYLLPDPNCFLDNENI